MSEQLVLRSERLSFMKAGGTNYRMTKFTSISNAKNPKEFSRQYVDMSTESSDVVGYAPSIAYAFDLHTENQVHAVIADISDTEKLGSNTHIEVITVDLFTTGDSKVAHKRTYSVVPDTDSDGTDSLAYSGNFKAVSEIETGTATTTDGWLTCTFVPATGAEYLVTFNVSAISGQVGGATILVNGQTLTTDVNGFAEISLANATYPVIVSKALYTTKTESATVSSASVYKPITIVLA